MTKEIPPIAIYDHNVSSGREIIKKLDLKWIEKRKKQILDFVQLYTKSDDGTSLDKACLRIAPFLPEIISKIFKEYELNIMRDFDLKKNCIGKDYSEVGTGHVSYFGKNQILFYGERPNVKHLEEIFPGKEIIGHNISRNINGFLVNLNN